jgi:WD40 repeat protein
VILWDVESGEQVRRWEGLGETVMGLAFTPDGHSLLVGIGTSPFDDVSLKGGLLLLDVQTGATLRRFEYTDEDSFPVVWGVAISPDGRTALSVFADNYAPYSITLWDLDTGEEIRKFEDSSEGIGAAGEGLAFTPDGRAFLSSSVFSGLVTLWDISTGEVIRKYVPEPGRQAHRVAISPDGTTFITAFGYSELASELANVMILRDLETGIELQRFEGHTRWVRGTDFSPDGSMVISASGDGTVRLWQVAGSDIMDWIASNRYVRELTPDEREWYRLDVPDNIE